MWVEKYSNPALKKKSDIPKEKPMQANIFTHPKGKTKALETLDRT